MARTWTIPAHIQEDSVAMVADDQPESGRVIVIWLENGEDSGERCDGWIDGDTLFVPFDGQSALGTNFDEQGLPEGSWYEAASGRTAIVGLSGSPLSVIR
jgi:hypothetical protein